jgi:hypothetical protein
MRRLVFFVSLAIGAGAVGLQAARADAPVMGGGAAGYDFLIGNWSCRNTMPSAMAGPSTFTLAVSRATPTSLFIRIVGHGGFDGASYLAYNAKTGWTSPSAYGDGSYGSESGAGKGSTVLFTGSYTDASGKVMRVRDTYTRASASTYTDLSEANMGGTWKAVGKSTCTKS